MSAPEDERTLEVLVVDDSAVVRQVMTAVLSRNARLRITTAADPLIAMDKMKRLRPDVIVLDIEMPRMDGLTFLRKLMCEDPIPVVICSGVATRGTELALRALDEGAVDLVTKPQLGVAEFLRDSALMLIDTIVAAAGARVGFRRPYGAQRIVAPRRPPGRRREKLASRFVVAIGASTGGPEAIRTLLQSLPPDAPGCAIVQHMPEHFTPAFAKRLDGDCAIEVREAADGDELAPGLALIAPGNRHLMVEGAGGLYGVRLGEGELVSRHRPSVDVLFDSVAACAGSYGIGVLLTGMGVDGARGMEALRRAGAATIAQDEESSVVFGMPREAIARGAVDEVVPLAAVPAALLKRVFDGSEGA